MLIRSGVGFFHLSLAHQNRTIAIASDFRVDGAKSPEIPQKDGVLGSEIAVRNCKSLATFHRTLKSQCSIAFSCLRNRCVFWGLRWASQSQIAKIATIFWCAKQKSGFLKRALAQTCFRAWYQVRFLRRIFGHSWGLVYGEGGAPGTVPLHNLRVTSHVLHLKVPLEWYRVRLF